MKKINLLIPFLLFIMLGCKTMPAAEPVKALLVEMNDSTKLKITKVVSDSMQGKSVRIADSVFSKENRMSVATNMTATFEGNPINGSVTELPQHYELMMRGTACYLVHEETDKEYVLEGVQCKAM